MTTPIAQGPVECRVMPHTPGPWKLGEFDEHLGYDCMTGGVRVGPAVLDGRDYGQKRCAEIDPELKARMLADAALIAAALDMLAALEKLARLGNEPNYGNSIGNQIARDAIAAAVRHNGEVRGASQLHGEASLSTAGLAGKEDTK